MAAQGRTQAESLRAELHTRPERFEFFQAVRLLEKLYRSREPVGGDHDPSREALRFRSSIRFGFPTSEIESLKEPERPAEGGDAPPLEMRVTFLGLQTPSSFGSLPLGYTELIRDEVQERRHQLLDFLDLFNHRWVSFFYRSWRKHKVELDHESGAGSPLEELLYSLFGFGLPALRDRLPFEDTALLLRAGLLGRAPVSASALERLLSSYFETAVTVEQLVSRTHVLDPDDQSRLGVANCTLGADCCLGDQVTLCQSSFRVRVGPLGWDEYLSFLPSGPAFEALVSLTRLAVGSEFDFDVQPILAGSQAQDIFLDSASDDTCRLGWSTVLKSQELEEDVREAIFDSAAHVTHSAGSPRETQLEEIAT
ncbi:MAG: type VI secretion system baseplate subunit TssG [Planctomycetota bacterium]